MPDTAHTRKINPSLSILVLTEDGGADASEVIEILSRRMLRYLDEYTQTHRIAFEPASDSARAACRANLWKSARHRRQQVDLVQTIATKLAEDRPSGFVFFHVDGDTVWSRRATSENRDTFQSLIRDRVGQILRESKSYDEGELDDRIARLVLLMPFYSIESWLYQNTKQAIELCHKHYGGRDVARFTEWATDRRALDEVHQPKDAVCLGGQCNQQLAKASYPMAEVVQAGTSLHAVVEALLACTALLDALQATYGTLAGT